MAEVIYTKDAHNAAVSKAKTAKRKRPTLEEALANRGIKSIAKTKAKTVKAAIKKTTPKKKKKNPFSPATQPKEHAAWRTRNT